MFIWSFPQFFLYIALHLFWSSNFFCPFISVFCSSCFSVIILILINFFNINILILLLLVVILVLFPLPSVAYLFQKWNHDTVPENQNNSLRWDLIIVNKGKGMSAEIALSAEHQGKTKKCKYLDNIPDAVLKLWNGRLRSSP